MRVDFLSLLILWTLESKATSKNLLPPFERVGFVCLFPEANSAVQPLIKPEVLWLASPRLRIQNWFLTLLNSACLISRIARITFPALKETSAPHTLFALLGSLVWGHLPGVKLNMLGIQRKKRCYWVWERGDEVLWEAFMVKRAFDRRVGQV